jgi:hypothetical protein
MMNHYITDEHTLSGTLGGTLLVLLYSIDPARLLDSVILAATGALVSFAASVFCKYLWRKLNKRS